MIGRAGVGTVSDDGAGALLFNPAGLARRGSARAQVGVSFVDDEMYWQGSQSAPANRDQSSSRLLPLAAIEGSLGEWIVGAGVMTAARSERVLRRPLTIPPEDFGSSFDYRYAGLSGAFRRDTFVLGGARRLTDTIAIGVSVGLSRVAVGEERRIWAGDTSRVVLGVPRPDVLGDPAHDVELGFNGVDNVIPSAIAGVLIAPEDSHVELAASVGWSAPVRAKGDVQGGGSTMTALAFGVADARIEIEQPVTVRTGARWLGERFIAEVGGDLYYVPPRARETRWYVDGASIIDTTTPGASRELALSAVTSRLSSRTHGALRGAIDVELVSGFLWATAGYAFSTAGVAGARQSPTFGDLGGHTLALGLEGSTGGFTVTLGWARTWSIRTPEPVSRWRLDNPFATGGDRSIPTGTFDGSTDMLGVSIDAELSMPD